VVRRYEKENNLPKTSHLGAFLRRDVIKTEDLVADREAGMTYKEIAEKYGVSKYMSQYRLNKINKEKP